jgi:formylmethanofuran dehydrogenase subunit E
MIIKTDYILSEYQRVSKLGNTHTYTRKKSIITFRCDCCGELFQRERGSMDPNRLNNNFYHVCSTCDIKRFAQQKGVENKHIWDMPVSSLKTLDQL